MGFNTKLTELKGKLRLLFLWVCITRLCRVNEIIHIYETTWLWSVTYISVIVSHIWLIHLHIYDPLIYTIWREMRWVISTTRVRLSYVCNECRADFWYLRDMSHGTWALICVVWHGSVMGWFVVCVTRLCCVNSAELTFDTHVTWVMGHGHSCVWCDMDQS